MLGGRVELDLSPADQLRGSGLRRALRIGISRAASPVKASTVRHAEAIKRYGFLAKSIRIRLRVYRSDKFVAVIGPSASYTRTKGKITRGPRKGQARKFRPSRIAHLVEKGTRHSRARPWLAPAFAESAGRYLRDVGTEIGREVEKELARAAAR